MSVWDCEGSIEMLTKLTAEAVTAQDIADRLKAHFHTPVSRMGVIGKQNRLGLENKVRPNDRKWPKKRRPPKPDVRKRCRVKKFISKERLAQIKTADEMVSSPVEARPGVAPLLERTGCAFPVEHDGVTWLFCNRPVERRDYCAVHHSRMYQVRVRF